MEICSILVVLKKVSCDDWPGCLAYIQYYILGDCNINLLLFSNQVHHWSIIGSITIIGSTQYTYCPCLVSLCSPSMEKHHSTKGPLDNALMDIV